MATACPFDGCKFVVSADKEPIVVVQLLQMHHSAVHTRPTVSINAEKVSRPQVTASGSSEDWQYFISRWSEYKRATHLTDADCVIQLLECCDDTLRRDLTRFSGGSLSTQSEKEVLAAMRSLAVREENLMVARVQLLNMVQDHDEPVRTFAARLRGQAAVCKFSIPCPRDGCEQVVSYQDEVIRDTLARGLADRDIQLDLLGAQGQTQMSLEDTIRFVEAKEAGKRSAQTLGQSQGAAAARSQYRRAKTVPTQPRPPIPTTPPDLCQYCGRTGHGIKASAAVRAASCPAFRSHCRHCRRRGHFTDACLQRKAAASRPHTQRAMTTRQVVPCAASRIQHTTLRLHAPQPCSTTCTTAPLRAGADNPASLSHRSNSSSHFNQLIMTTWAFSAQPAILPSLRRSSPTQVVRVASQALPSCDALVSRRRTLCQHP